jgi:adenosylmethionine-8-amino-7-oxononanoate aminotransferase
VRAAAEIDQKRRMSPFFLSNVMVLMPPLSTSLPELRRMVEILREAIEAVTPLQADGAGS